MLSHRPPGKFSKTKSVPTAVHHGRALKKIQAAKKASKSSKKTSRLRSLYKKTLRRPNEKIKAIRSVKKGEAPQHRKMKKRYRKPPNLLKPLSKTKAAKKAAK